MSDPWLSIIGIGEDGLAGLSPASRAALDAAGQVFGAPRHLALAGFGGGEDGARGGDGQGGEGRGDEAREDAACQFGARESEDREGEAQRTKGHADAAHEAKAHAPETQATDRAARSQAWPVPFSLAPLLARRGRPTAMLVSGDPFWHGAGGSVAAHLDPAEWRAFPVAGTFSLAAARLGWRIEDTLCLGLHAAPFARLRRDLAPGGRAICLLRDADAPAALAVWLTEQGFGASRLWVLERLGGPAERVRETTAERFAEGLAAGADAAPRPDVAAPPAAARGSGNDAGGERGDKGAAGDAQAGADAPASDLSAGSFADPNGPDAPSGSQADQRAAVLHRGGSLVADASSSDPAAMVSVTQGHSGQAGALQPDQRATAHEDARLVAAAPAADLSAGSFASQPGPDAPSGSQADRRVAAAHRGASLVADASSSDLAAMVSVTQGHTGQAGALQPDQGATAHEDARLVADVPASDLGAGSFAGQRQAPSRMAAATAPPITAPVAVAIDMSDGPGLPRSSGLPETAFAHDGQITKSPIRALTLAALAPRRNELLWDLGAGSGSVSVEWCLAGGRAVAVETRAGRAANIRANAAAFGVDLRVVEGRSADVIAELPDPAAVFVGGGFDAALAGALWDRLRPGTRLVVNGVTLETEALLARLYAAHGGTLLRIELARAAPLGAMSGWEPARPVVQWAVTR